LKSEAARKVAEHHRRKVLDVDPDATFHEVAEVERASHEAIFDLVQGRYIQLIFHINQAFSVGRFPLAADRDGTPQHREFVPLARGRSFGLAAIAQGDVGAFRHGLPPGKSTDGESLIDVEDQLDIAALHEVEYRLVTRPFNFATSWKVASGSTSSTLRR